MFLRSFFYAQLLGGAAGEKDGASPPDSWEFSSSDTKSLRRGRTAAEWKMSPAMRPVSYWTAVCLWHKELLLNIQRNDFQAPSLETPGTAARNAVQILGVQQNKSEAVWLRQEKGGKYYEKRINRDGFYS